MANHADHSTEIDDNSGEANAGIGRRRWVLGQPAHVIPTEAGDYVLLTKPRPPGSPQLPPLDDSREPLPQAHRPLTPWPAGPPPQGRRPVVNPLDCMLQGRALQHPLPLPPSAMLVSGSRAQTNTEARKASREHSVNRFREAKLLELQGGLAAALRASERDVASSSTHASPQTAEEEQAQIAAAIKASMAGGSTDGGARDDASPRRLSMAAGRLQPAASSSDVEAAGSAMCRPTQSSSSSQPSSSLSRQARSASYASSMPQTVVEERQQVALALAESLRTAEAQRSDERHDDAVALLGAIDSLQAAGPHASRLRDAGERGSARGLLCQQSCAHHGLLARQAGRDLARRALEVHFLSGDAMLTTGHE